MWRVQYQQVTVTLSAATINRLEREPFNKARVADHAVEKIRLALFTIFPPRTPAERKDRSRMQGFVRYAILTLYDGVCFVWRNWTGRTAGQESYAARASAEPINLTLNIPTGLVKWIEEIARRRQSTVPDATVYAIEYGIWLDSQGGAEEAGQRLRQEWHDFLRAIWKRLFVQVK